jgi:predicted aminopeptidase
MVEGVLAHQLKDSPKVQTWAKSFAITSSVLLLSSCYSTAQAWYQGQRLLSRDDIEDVVTNPTTDQKIRSKLQLVGEILRFAKSNGLNAEDSYRHYVDTQNGPVSYLVQASHKDRFDNVTWWFPFVGRVPYLGFFHREDREEVAMELDQEGYDVAKPSAQAFSSLGWFSDPVYTGMLRGGEGDLAELFLHELVHRTVWISGNARLNESLAEFVGRRLALRYLEERSLNDEVSRVKKYHASHQRLITWVKSLRAELQSVYGNGDLPRAEKLEQKASILSKYTKTMWPFNDDDPLDHLQTREWNNAWILGFSLYYDDLSDWEQIYQCMNSPAESAFLLEVEKVATSQTNVSDLRHTFCEQG